MLGAKLKTAKEQGYKLLQDPLVAAAIEQTKKEATDRNGITVDRVLQELARIEEQQAKALDDLAREVKRIGQRCR